MKTKTGERESKFYGEPDNWFICAQIGSLEEETHLVMKNLKGILTEAGLTFENVIKTSIFISDMNNFSTINKIYAEYFSEETAPARETVEVANLPKFVNVEISAIAVMDA